MKAKMVYIAAALVLVFSTTAAIVPVSPVMASYLDGAEPTYESCGSYQASEMDLLRGLFQSVTDEYDNTEVMKVDGGDSIKFVTGSMVSELYKYSDGAIMITTPEQSLRIVPQGIGSLSTNSVELELGEDNQVLYRDVYGKGKNLQYVFLDNAIVKNVIIESLEALGGLDTEYLEIPFTLETTDTIYIGEREWLGERIIVNGELRIGSDLIIDPPLAVDIEGNQTDVSYELVKDQSETVIIKRIPVQWLETAVFPVYADLTITLDGATTFESGSTYPISIDTLDSTHFVIAFGDVSDSEKGKVVAGSVSGTAITITLDGATTFESGITDLTSIAALNSTHFVIAFRDQSHSWKGKVISGSVSGTTISITPDTATTFGTRQAEYITIAALDSTHFVIAYREPLDSSRGKVIAGSVSGTAITITLDGATTFESGSTRDPCIAALDSTHFVIAFRDGSDNGRGKVIAGSVSGTAITITLDGATKFESGQTTSTYTIAALDSTHFVIAFQDDSDSYKGKVIAGSVSGTAITITLDGATTFESGYTYDPSIAALDSTHFVIAFRDDSDSGKGKVIAGSVFGTAITITLDGATTFESGGTYYPSIAALSSTHFVIAFRDISDSNEGKVIAGSAPAPTPSCDSVTTATNTGTASFCTSSGTISDVTAVAEGELLCSEEGKPNLQFPHGFFSFNVTGLAVGQQITVTITLPDPVPSGSQYWKCHDPEWIDMTPFLSDNDGDNVLILTLTNGGIGDDDGDPNNDTIVDQGGPGFSTAVVAPAFPSLYVGIAAALAAGVLAYLLRRRLLHQK